MMKHINIFSTRLCTIALLLVCINGVVWPKQVTDPSGSNALRRSMKLRQQLDSGRRLKPALDNVALENYSSALQGFQKLESTEGRHFTRQKAMCLLHLNRAKDGIALLRDRNSDRIPTSERFAMLTALAVSAHDEEVLRYALSGFGLTSRLSATKPKERTQVLRSWQEVQDREVGSALMRVALRFGRRYDRTTMHLIAGEAIRRGGGTPDALLEYAGQCATNGDLTKALALYSQAEKSAKDPQTKARANFGVYQTKNIIYQFTRTRTIQEEEERRHVENRAYYKAFWN